MARLPAGLAWVFDLTVTGESTWRYYVDSGNGRLIKRELLRNGTDVWLTVEYADYREIAAPTLTTAVSVEVRGKMQPLEHFVMPYRIAYRSEEHTSELQSLMRISYAVFCLKKKNKTTR